MEIIVAKQAGFCFGVKRAIKILEETAKKADSGEVCTLGPIVHNPQLVKKLEIEGIRSVDDLSQLSDKKVKIIVIRTHGVPPHILEKAKKMGLNVVDATCQFVRRAQESVKRLKDEGYDIVIIGEKNHPEVIGLVSYSGGTAKVVENSNDAKLLDISNARIGVVIQTTQSQDLVNRVMNILISKTRELKVFNTICRATEERQNSAKEVAKKVDVMIVIGGYNSGNTKRLAEICSSIVPTHHIETADDLRKEWFKGVNKVGITAGASTPDFIIENVAKRLRKM